MKPLLTRRLAPACAGLLALLPATLCLWDRDTLRQERARFPTALELVTGGFPRHSDAYYRWRIEECEARRTAGEGGPELFDDLAVACSKLGDDGRAIELMGEKEALHPGLYETAANLGTFYIHAGELETGIEYIARAIEIDPAAHFGREVYQELLARYVLARRAPDGALRLPLSAETTDAMFTPESGFWIFVRNARGVPEEEHGAEIQRATQGVLGMLRFGNHDSPVLLEALADLLLAPEWEEDAKLLAARALLKASYEVTGPGVREAYRAKAQACLSSQIPESRRVRSTTIEEVEEVFREELRVAETWWSELAAAEAEWIAAGADVDARFAAAYYDTDTSPFAEEDAPGVRPAELALLVVAFVAAGWILLRQRAAVRSRPSA